MRNPLTPARRRWLYGITIAALPVCVLLGWLPAEVLPVLVPLIMAVFNVPNDSESSDTDG